MIHRYGPCIGLTLFKWKRFKIELWYAPKWYAVPEHTHNESDGEFFIMWARHRLIYRVIDGRRQEYTAHTPWWGKCLSVRAGTPHAFLSGTSPMIWLCFERWKSDKVTSVATDLHLTRKKHAGMTRHDFRFGRWI